MNRRLCTLLMLFLPFLITASSAGGSILCCPLFDWGAAEKSNFISEDILLSSAVINENFIDKSKLVTTNLVEQNSYSNSGFFTLFIILCIISLLIPLLVGFHWRWFIGSLVACIFWGPFGLIFSLYVAGLILISSDRIFTDSPRDLMEELADSKIIHVLMIISLVVLTAISILGGIIAIGLVYFYYKFTLLFMPKSSERGFISFPNTYSTKVSSSSSVQYSSNNMDSSDNDYDDRYSNYEEDDDDDDDDDDDNNDKGSAWDGWLVKW